MAYDDELAERVRLCLTGVEGITEKRMFGGLAFLVDGHMALAANSRGAMMVRIDPSRVGELTVRDGVRPTVMRGRELKGWLDVDTAALTSAEELDEWVWIGIEQARSQPAE
ncbi:RNA methyltransferase [Nocardioides sp. Soil797]|nr:RNA methyltransferase [Nocardioides sp. Soil797]